MSREPPSHRSSLLFSGKPERTIACSLLGNSPLFSRTYLYILISRGGTYDPKDEKEHIHIRGLILLAGRA